LLQGNSVTTNNGHGVHIFYSPGRRENLASSFKFLGRKNRSGCISGNISKAQVIQNIKEGLATTDVPKTGDEKRNFHHVPPTFPS